MNFSVICNDQTLFETRKFYETLGFNCEIVQKSDNLSELFLKENKKLKIKNGIIELSTTENLDQIVTWSAHRNDSTENMSNSLTETESSDQTSKIKGAGPSATILMPRQLSEHEKTSFITDILKIYDPNMNELHLTHSYGNFQTFSQRKAIFDKKTVHSTVNVPILSDSKSKRCRIGVLTSGGDSPGMNTCLGTILKLGKRYDIDIICFKNGFKGLVNDEIIDLSHLEDDKEDFCKTEICIGQSLCQIVESAKTEKLVEHLSFLINPQTFNFNTAGTLIGTARCEEFKTESGLKSAIKTVMKNDLTGLIMMGGDGTMRGGKLLAERYFEFAKEIAKNDTISKNEIAKFIKVIHIPFSIDNDIPSAYTIGTDTALQTICDSSVILHSTFSAHNRLYVMEVMGRDSHYLSTVSGVCFADYIIYDTFSHNSNDSGCSESDWITPLITKVKSCPKKCVAVVLSESAHLCETHHQKMAEKLVQEGVLTEQQIANCPKSSNTECQIKRISCNYVKDITNQYIDSRVLTLGHLQRGCKPVAYDRIISVLSGVEAVDQILNLFNLSVSLSNKENSLETENEKMNDMTKPVSIILNHNHLIKRDLANLLNRIENKLTESSMKDHIERVVRMDINKMSCSGRFLLDNLLPDKQNVPETRVLFLVHSYNIPGINMLINKIHFKLKHSKIKSYAAMNGFDGLLMDDIIRITGGYNEETDCVFGYSHDNFMDLSSKNKHEKRQKDLNYNGEQLTKIAERLNAYDRIVIIGQKDAIELVHRIQEYSKDANILSKIILMPFSKYLHSVPGSYSVLLHIVNILDSLRSTFHNKIYVKFSDESLALLASLAVGGQFLSNYNSDYESGSNSDSGYKPDSKYLNSEEFQGSQAKIKDKIDHKTDHKIDHKTNPKGPDNPFSRRLKDEAQIITYSERCMFSNKLVKNVIEKETDAVYLDLSDLESPNRLFGWDRSLVVLYSVFCSELLLNMLEGEKMTIFSDNFEYKDDLKILVITEEPRLLNRTEFSAWIKLETRKYLIYKKILKIIEG